MNPGFILPDVESIVVAYLKAWAVTFATIDPKNIGSDMPPKSDFPFLQVSIPGGTVAVERYLGAPTVQIDAWGGTRMEARVLCAAAHAAIIEMVGIQGDLGTVTGVGTILHPRRRTDGTSNRPVYTCEVQVWTHATPIPA